MKIKYLIRLDDACPTMDKAKWEKVLDILDNYGIRPMIGIIPNNQDAKQRIDNPDIDFWIKAKTWEQKGYAIALHGYDHCYISTSSGVNPMWNRSEFAGISYEKQCQKIRDGYTILKKNGLNPKFFFAPSHTFDENTLAAIKKCTDIRIISDTIATKPYRSGDFIFVPQLGGKFKEVCISGFWTFCMHPSYMSDLDFKNMEHFLKMHKDDFIGFDQLDLTHVRKKDIFSRLLSNTYFLYRKIRGIH